jgi:hypothetical protein
MRRHFERVRMYQRMQTRTLSERAALRQAQVEGARKQWGSAVPAVRFNLLPGREFSVIGLDALIEVKAQVGRGKDKILEEELRAVRARRTAGKLGKPPETA